jgi:hypothetical protein
VHLLNRAFLAPALVTLAAQVKIHLEPASLLPGQRAERHKVNPFNYLVALQRCHVLVEDNPEEWMPWNYATTLEGLGLPG